MILFVYNKFQYLSKKSVSMECQAIVAIGKKDGKNLLVDKIVVEQKSLKTSKNIVYFDHLDDNYLDIGRCHIGNPG